MKIKKGSPGLDQRNRLGRVLGDGFVVEDYDATRPLAAQVGDADVLLVRDVPITREVIDAAVHLKLIQRPGDHLPRMREIDARQSVKARRVGLPKTMSVHGKTLGLVGLGNTGEALARIAVPFGLRVVAVKRTADDALARALGLAWLGTMGRLPELLAEADFVSLHLPNTQETVGMIGARELGLMKQGAFVINISRAPMLDRAALLDALRAGHLGGAAADVWWEEPADPADPLLAMPNVILTPHIAADTAETEQRLAELTADNVRRIARGEAPRYVVGVDVDAGQ